jgi:hypothetical protein
LSGKPLSDNEVDDRLKAARDALGDATAETTAGSTALSTARRALDCISYLLIAAGVKRQETLPPG